MKLKSDLMDLEEKLLEHIGDRLKKLNPEK